MANTQELVGGFPDHGIDPRLKDKNWVLQFVKAAWDDYNKSTFQFGYNDKSNIDVIKTYSQGKQSAAKYKPLLGIERDSDNSWYNIDWSILPLVPKFRRIAIGMMMSNDYNIMATPIDALAQDETGAAYAAAKTKVIMREALRSMDPELLKAPAMQSENGDPQDMEELEIQAAYTMKHQMAVEAEMGIKLVFNQNDVEEQRRRVFEELFDVGYAGYREWIDDNNKIRVRAIRPDNLVVSACRNADFSDKFYAGEIVELTIAELRKIAGEQFKEDDYKDIATKLRGRWGNANSLGDFRRINHSFGYDKSRVQFLDIEFYSTNDLVYEERIDRRNNLIFGRAGFEDKNNRKNKFKRASFKVVYKAKWIIGTDYMFDFGLCTDMKRAKSSLSDTEMSFHIRACDFYDMKAVGKMQNLIPIADAIQLAWYKLQNSLAQAIPGGWSIDLSALEDVALGSGGAKMTPKQLLDMFWQRNTIVYRSQNSIGQGTPNKPVEYQPNSSFSEVKFYWDMIQSYVETLRQITGLNEMTDGSTPNARTLTTVAKMAGQASNNAMSDVTYAERKLLEKLAGAVILRLQDVVQREDVQGYVRSLGTNTIQFFRMNVKFALHEFGIDLQQKPDFEERASLIQHLEQYAATGLVNPEDYVMIKNIDNMKQAEQMLAYRVKKRKEQMQQEAQQQQQMNGQIQQQSAQVVEQSRQQTLQLEYQLKMELIKLKGEIDTGLLQMKLAAEAGNVNIKEQGKEKAAKISAQSKAPSLNNEDVFNMDTEDQGDMMGEMEEESSEIEQPAVA